MISRAEVEAAQDSWGRGLLDIGAGISRAQRKELATLFVERHYHLSGGELLFCPTKAGVDQFRGSLRAAVSYFVGQDSDYGEDTGFALESWTSVRFENFGVVCRRDVAMAIGNYFFSRADGSALKAEFSLVYLRDPAGVLKIQLHHSALPFGGG